MSLARTLAVVVVALVLTTTLVTANVVAAAHLTVLDPDFVANSVDEEGGYALVEEATREATGVENESTTETAEFLDPSALLRDAVTEEYVRSQTEANVERAYAYLHGERDDLNLSVATAPIRENVSAALASKLRNASVVDLVGQTNATLDGPVNATVIERMTANRSSYRDVKTEFRAAVRERVLDAAVEEAFAASSDDELLALVIDDYDPNEYSDEEKAQMVEEREESIRSALRDEIERERGDQIDERVEDELATVRQEVTAGDEETAGDTPTEAAVANLTTAVADGLTTDASYDDFRADVASAKADLADAAAAEADDRLAAELPARIDLTEGMDAETRRSVEQARTVVQWFDRLAFVLPAVAAGLIGLLYVIRRSVPAVASDAGWSLLSAGLPTVVGVELARSRLRPLVDGAPAEQRQIAEVMVGLAERVLNTLGDVAVVLTVGGAVLVVGSLVVRYGVLDHLRARYAGPDGGSP